MEQVINVPDGKILFPYFVDEEMAAEYIQCFASFIDIEYDEEGVEVATEQDRARKFVTKQLDKIYEKWQERRNKADDRAAGAIKSGGIS
jgi:hypothetical protein